MFPALESITIAKEKNTTFTNTGSPLPQTNTLDCTHGALWLERWLTSPLTGALVHAVEATALLVEADVVAGRIFDKSEGAPCVYVGTPGLQISPWQRRALQQWPLEPNSLFASLEQLGSNEQLMLVPHLLSDVKVRPSAAMPEPLKSNCRLADSFAVLVPIEEDCWTALLLLRHRRRPPFVTTQREAARLHRTTIGRTLLRGLRAQHPPSPSADTLLARLSQTERDVLELLRQDLTEREAAERLQRSPHTVHVHVKNIYRKLAVRSRQQLLTLIGDNTDRKSITGIADKAV